MAFIKAEEVYNWYVDVACRRHNTLMTFQKEYEEICRLKTGEELLPLLEKMYKKEAEYRAPKTKAEQEQSKNIKKTWYDDFEIFKKNIRYNTIVNNFANEKEVLEVKEKLITALETGDEITKNTIIDGLYKHFGQEIRTRKLEDKTIQDRMVRAFMEEFNRRIISDGYLGEVNGFKDKGNCTKGITVSLLNAESEFGISLFPKEGNKENVAHPQTLMESIGEKYIKEGNLKDMDLKAGDIIIMRSRRSGTPRHAIMVSAVNEEKAQTIEYSPLRKMNITWLHSKTGDPINGIIIDVKSFISDKVSEHNREEEIKMMFGKQKSSTR